MLSTETYVYKVISANITILTFLDKNAYRSYLILNMHNTLQRSQVNETAMCTSAKGFSLFHVPVDVSDVSYLSTELHKTWTAATNYCNYSSLHQVLLLINAFVFKSKAHQLL